MIKTSSRLENMANAIVAGEECESMVKQLLENRPDIEADHGKGRPALLWAAGEGHEAVVKLLLDNGADIEARDEKGCTSLCIAALHKQEACSLAPCGE
jgi:ankyrin repeat protein